MEKKQLAPTAITSLVLGILSINFSLLIIPGFILSLTIAACGRMRIPISVQCATRHWHV